MSTRAMLVVAVLLAAGGFGAGLMVRGLGDADPAAVAETGPSGSGVSTSSPELAGGVDAVSAQRPAFDFVDQQGTARDVSDWDGQVVVVNFWATWCAPCLIEIPYFIAQQERLGDKGLQFVGVALDDSDKVKAFVDEIGMNYPTAHGQQNALDLMRAYGNKTGGLPFTAFVGRDGNIAFRKAGVLTEEELEEVIRELL